MMNAIAFLFGAVLILAQMTSLRGDASIGLLDFALVATAVMSAFVTLALGHRHDRAGERTPRSGVYAAISSPVFLYGAISTLVIMVSLGLNFQRSAASTESLSTAALPFLANAVVIAGFVLTLYHKNATAMLSGFITASLLIGAYYVLGYLTQNADMMYESRFKGLALNPNQTALQALATLLVLIAALVKLPPERKIMLTAALVALPLTMIYGVGTGSDSLILCLPGVLAAAGIIVMDRLRVKLWVVIVSGAVLGAGFLLALAIAIPGIFGGVGQSLQAQFSQGSQDTDRQLLWQNGIAAWSDSPWFGHGPGAWSGIGGPYQGLEAHNSVIDWLTIGGIIGVIPILGIIFSAFRFSPRLRLFRVVGLLTLAIFTMFHFTFRLPIFWLAVAVLVSPFFSWADDVDRRNAKTGMLPAQ